jgi:hypothetical protein
VYIHFPYILLFPPLLPQARKNFRRGKEKSFSWRGKKMGLKTTQTDVLNKN